MFGGYNGCESSDRGCGWCGGVGVVEVVCRVRMGVVVGGVRNRGEGVVNSGGFSKSTWKTFHTVSHSCSISVMSFCRFAWKEEVVKVLEALIDQRVGRSVGDSKSLNGLRTGSHQWG